MRIMDSILTELEQEAAITQRVLERVPGDRLTWQPHPKSMSLGQLALHLAMIPGEVTGMLVTDAVEMTPAEFESLPALPATAAAILEAHAASVAKAQEILSGLEDSAVMATWRLTVGGVEVFAGPKASIVRALVLNHGSHHRGQLAVYLRLLEVPVPSIYGPSADETPLAGAGGR